jgi:hypothetical protein
MNTILPNPRPVLSEVEGSGGGKSVWNGNTLSYFQLITEINKIILVNFYYI